jgi:hypothetical protein
MKFIFLCLVFALLALSPRVSRAQASEPANPQNAAADSAAAKAAARKKHFEEEKRRLEGQEDAPPNPAGDGEPILYITPTTAGMLVGESRGFTLFDTDGHKLTSAAEWSVSSSYHATITQEPILTVKNEGTFKVIARIGKRTAEATVKVYPGDKLPVGAARWSVAPIPSSKPGGISKTVQAAPASSGPRPKGPDSGASSPPQR